MTTEAIESGNAEPAELAKFSRLASRWWDESGPLATLHAINPLRTDYIAARATLDGARVLDVGCGGGILSEALARRGARVVGIDLAGDGIDVARAHAKDAGLAIDYRVTSAEAVAAAEPDAYDVVTCLELLEHVPDPGAIVAACARAVRPGGCVFFSTINRNLRSFLLAIVGAEHVLGLLPRGTHEYLKLIRPSELARAARKAGLDVLDLTGLHYNPLTRSYWFGDGVSVNYFLSARRPVPA
ncbi:MAG TPA: bifunctional 2-polyprenyl-6-hydroxyphenol methylase/3-demethylubiquinol 3-O-methyltransferase UbiG [Gammaproteobacteria bacterium]|nr:bifunctional 2-polyprenyl-6-hydroxyphenol methylase/3-demethylubiquinol 3-O-methyltransferase UbiG [Gammaproteobacteria bacterium]